jgi:ribosome biogenesis GTPase
MAGPPAVGDWVGLDLAGGAAVVRAILPRAGALARRRPGAPELEQVAAANVDLVLVVDGLDRGPNPRRIERAAALAWDAGASPVVVLTKRDLCPDLEAALARAREGAPFAEVLAVAAASGEGMAELEALLTPGRTAVLLGPSGTGKSTLANRLLGEAHFAVAAVRDGDRRGRHTTTHRELVRLPSGACLIDTPGIRELGLWLDAGAVEAVFPEIEAAADGCRFGDCRHEGEPGCAVAQAAARGEIDPARLASFQRLRREAENLAVRRDASRRHELRARERSFGRMARAVMRLKNRR